MLKRTIIGAKSEYSCAVSAKGPLISSWLARAVGWLTIVWNSSQSKKKPRSRPRPRTTLKLKTQTVMMYQLVLSAFSSACTKPNVLPRLFPPFYPLPTLVRQRACLLNAKAAHILFPNHAAITIPLNRPADAHNPNAIPSSKRWPPSPPIPRYRHNNNPSRLRFPLRFLQRHLHIPTPQQRRRAQRLQLWRQHR